jgi:Rieske Fe-S protein
MSATEGISRRHVLGGTAALGVAGPLLAGCGSDDVDGDDQSPPAAASPGTVLTTAAEVPVGGGVILTDPGVVVTQPEQGTFKGFSATCTHQGCTVASVSETINCTCHGSRFSITDGSVQNGPATSDLPEKPVTLEGDQIKLA